MENKNNKKVLSDASLLITEACVQSGADAFIGYPIIPSNRFYAYVTKRFPLFMAGPDEITVMQWMSGLASAGKFPVTATAFPGFALMLEGLNMAYMMELPMLIILTQRLGPSTGSATTGAQGDLRLLNGCISGGYTCSRLNRLVTSDDYLKKTKSDLIKNDRIFTAIDLVEDTQNVIDKFKAVPDSVIPGRSTLLLEIH